MNILSLADLIAPLHPVLVHLPIGILLLACFFQWLTLSNRFVFLQPAIPVVLFWGMIGAVVSCISGYLLAQGGDYDALSADRHQWFGIITAIFSLVLYLLHKLSIGERWGRGLSLVLILLITITGHLGGTLTHGEGYLTSGFNKIESKKTVFKNVSNIQEAAAYNDIVQPILEAKCYSCHSSAKQKGKLRLDEQELILKGGKEGKVLVPGKADESEMIKRILLPVSDEDHMPPKAKTQLTPSEISVLHWWVSSGADFNKKVKDLQQTDKVKPALASIQSGEDIEKIATDVPGEPVEKGDDKVISQLRKEGVVVIPVAQNSNYLSVNFVIADTIADSTMQLLGSLKRQLIWLKADNASIVDSSLDHITACTSLTRLHLNNTKVTDKGLAKLQSLQQLQSLNLVGTKVTAVGLLQLQKLPALKSLYLYRTDVSSNDWSKLKKAFPSVQLDTGKYVVPTLTADTTEIKF